MSKRPVNVLRDAPGRMVRTGLAGLLLLAAFGAQAQWPIGIGSSNDEEVVVTRVSPTGDVYVAGHFSGTLETAAGNVISNGLQDVFVARISASGQLQWIKSAGGELVDTVRDLALDSANSVYIVGDFYSTALFGGSDLTANGSLQDAYLAKIDAGGSWRWSRRIGGSGADRANAVATLPGDTSQIPPIAESVLVAGDYQCSASFDDPDSDPLPALGNGSCPDGRDLFIARYTASGDGIWAVDRGTSASGSESIRKMKIDAAGRAWIIGEFADGGTQSLLNENFDASVNSFPGGWGRSNTTWAAVTHTNSAAAGLLFIFGQLPFPLLSNPQSIFTGTPALALRGGAVNADTPARNADASQQLRVGFRAMRGIDQTEIFFGTNMEGIFSERPDAGENLVVQWLGSDNVWRTLRTFPGSGVPGEQFDFTGANALTISDPLAFHSGFQLRFGMTSGNGAYVQQVGSTGFFAVFDWWHVDDVSIERIGAARPMLLSLGNLLSPTAPSFGAPSVLDRGLAINDLAIDEGGNRILLTGQRSNDAALGTCGTLSGNGAFLASINRTSLACVWTQTATSGSASAVTVDGQGNAYITGSFTDRIEFTTDLGLLSASPTASDIFIARYGRDGGPPLWATGGGVLNDDEDDPNFGIPAFAGGLRMIEV